MFNVKYLYYLDTGEIHYVPKSIRQTTQIGRVELPKAYPHCDLGTTMQAVRDVVRRHYDENRWAQPPFTVMTDELWPLFREEFFTLEERPI